jgi:uncharacterized protein YbjT (DUF2867 family)
MRVGILGGTGFVGGYLVDALFAHGHQPVVLVRPGSEERVSWRERCTLIAGEVADDGAVRALVQGSDALIYNIGILRELAGRGITFEALHWRGAKRAMDLAVDAGGRRFLLMSANGVRADGTTYQRTKYKAEEYLRTTGLPFTIYRPSVIFGPPRGRMEIATQLYRDIIRPPLPAPLFCRGLLPSDAGAFRLAPIHVEEVAGAFAQGLEDPGTIGKTLLLCGPEDLTWREMLRRIAAASGQPRKLMLPVPAAPLGLAARLLERFPAFPITADQLQMLLEGNTCEAGGGDVVRGLRRFDATNLSYLASAA